MKVLYYDCFCGISGDMNLGALLDVGVDEAYLRKELLKLDLASEYELLVKGSKQKGISGTRVDVVLKPSYHSHHHHDSKEVHQAHRNLKDIENIIANSCLGSGIKEQSMAIFKKIAEAEAKVHGKTIDEVHFHEVGAVDSIVDIVGAAICLDYLKVDKIMASQVQLGGGFVRCAHGTFPVPAPATVEILKEIPIKTGIVPFETTTPTGAAILAANVDLFTDHIQFSIDHIGYGIGHREFEIPNVLRVYLGREERPQTNRDLIINAE